MPEIGSILQGAAGLAGLVVNPIMQHQQNQWNAHQMAQQNQWNIEQWRRETEYNSPVNQMARLRAAGINPALAFSEGGLVNEAAASPAMQASQGIAPQVDVSSIANLGLQSTLVASQAELNQAKSEEIRKKLPEEVQNLQQSRINMQKQVDEMNESIRQMSASIESMSIENQLKEAQKLDIKFQQTMQEKSFNLKIREVNASIDKMRADAAFARSARDLNERRLYEDVQTWAYRLLGFDLSNQKVLSECQLTQRMIVNAEYDGALLGLQVESGKLKLDQTAFDTMGARTLLKSGALGAPAKGILGTLQLLTSPIKGIISIGL